MYTHAHLHAHAHFLKHGLMTSVGTFYFSRLCEILPKFPSPFSDRWWSICVSYILSRVCQTGQPAVLHSKTFSIGHYMQTVEPNSFIPAMRIGTIDFYCFIPPSLTLTLAEGNKVSAKQTLFASFSPTLFIWSGLNLKLWCSNSNWTSWDYLLVTFIETRGITAVLLPASKNFNIGVHWEV